jgi:hypothetical protein
MRSLCFWLLVKRTISNKDSPASIKDLLTSKKDSPASIKDSSTSKKDSPASIKDSSTSKKDSPASIKDSSTGIENTQILKVCSRLKIFSSQRFSLRNLPNFHNIISATATGNSLSIWADGHGINVAGISLQSADCLSRRRIP